MKNSGVVLLVVLITTSTVFAQGQGETKGTGPQMIERVVIRGVKRIPEKDIRSWIQTREGNKYSPQALDRDVRALFDTGHFSDVKVFVEDEPQGGKLITFAVVDKPLILDVVFEGIDSAQQAEVIEEWRGRKVDLSKGSEFDVAVMRRAARIMENLLRGKNNTNVKVEPLVEQRTASQVLVRFKAKPQSQH